MNSVVLIGRLTKDPQVRNTANGMAVASFTLAVDRPTKSGEKRQADFPRIIAFGKTAETCGKYLSKGRQIAVSGQIRTGSYQNQNGDTIYTTDIVANRIEFLGSSGRKEQNNNKEGANGSQGYFQDNYHYPESDSSDSFEEPLPDFQEVDENILF